MLPPEVVSGLRYGQEEVELLAQALYERKVAVYVATLRALSASFGKDLENVTLDRAITDQLRSEAEHHAGYIVDTYNRELTAWAERKELVDPLQLLAEFEEWSIQRADSRSELIAITETYGPFADATLSFFRDNGRHGVLFDFGGHGDPHPECEICEAIKARNPWSLDQAVQLGVPHPGCRQLWHATNVDAADLPDMLVVGLTPGGILGQDTLIHQHGTVEAAVAFIEEMR